MGLPYWDINGEFNGDMKGFKYYHGIFLENMEHEQQA
jgi:hypothetical protein